MMKRKPSTLSHHAITRIYLVHLGFQQSKNCMRQYRYFSRMAYNLAPQSNFLYGFFQCQLLEDTIDIEITVRMMKGIHTFKKDCSKKASSCSLWGSQVHPFPSLVKEIEVYLEKRRIIADPFHLSHAPTLIDPITSPFVGLQTPKRKKTKNPKKRSRKVNHQSSRKHCKVR